MKNLAALISKNPRARVIAANIVVSRLWARHFLPRRGPLENLYLATVQKTGSQWMKAVFADRRIRAYTHLQAYPQRRYEWGEFVKRFPKQTFIPGLYISYDLYQEIEKPARYRTIYVLRDPRDITVSWYWSMLESHKLMGKVGSYRANLDKLDLEAGLHYAIDALTLKYAQMRTWAINRLDPKVLFVRLEEIEEEPVETLQRIFTFCGLSIPTSLTLRLASDYSKTNMRSRDLRFRSADSVSHYRSKRSKHQEMFTDSHREHFAGTAGNLIELLGYPAD